MDFLKDFNKKVEKIDGVGKSSQPPRFWLSFGNYVLNRIMAGSFMRGVPQGRITGLAGPSGAGKSFILGNLVKSAQAAGAHILVIDSENALDDEYMEGIGVDVDNGYSYCSVVTITQVSKVVSAFVKGFRDEYASDLENAPKVFIAIDSLDMLMTETEVSHYSKGDTKGDQGQRAKQVKAMLRTFVQDIKDLNIAMAVTSQVYPNQDLMNGEGLWMVNQSVRYSLSQIALVSKLKLKDTDTAGYDKVGDSRFAGINMKCVGFKTRFTQPFQEVTIQVPYATGMDPYNGLLDVAKQMGVVTQSGSRYRMEGQEESWYSKEFYKYQEQVLMMCEKKSDALLTLDKSAGVEEDTDTESKLELAERRRSGTNI